MIQHMEDMSCPCSYQRVVEGGAEIDQDEGSGEDGATEEARGTSSHRGHDQINSADKRKAQANSMRNGIGQNVAEFVLRSHELIIIVRQPFNPAY